MDLLRPLALFWLVVLAYGDYGHFNNGSSFAPESSKIKNNRPPRSYGLTAGYSNPFPVAYQSQAPVKHVPKTTEDPRTEESRYNADSAEGYDKSPDKSEDADINDEGNDGDDYSRVKKIKEVSIQTDISLVPKENDKSLDPVYQQQGRGPGRVVRPMRDLSILVRNPHRNVIIARQVPVRWVPVQPLQPHHHYPLQPRPVHPGPRLPMMPSHHKPRKPKKKKPKHHCHHHHPKPKKPKKKPKEHCHHHKPKKPHHKKLIYYAPVPTVNSYYYGSNRQPGKLIVPTSTAGGPAANSYSVEESPDAEELAEELTEDLDDDHPFHTEIEDDVESHRLSEPLEPLDAYDDDDPSESKVKAVKTV